MKARLHILIVYHGLLILFIVKRRPLYLFSGSLVAAALAIQAGYAWGSPYINPEIKVRLKRLLTYIQAGYAWGSLYINPEIKVRLKGLLTYIQAGYAWDSLYINPEIKVR